MHVARTQLGRDDCTSRHTQVDFDEFAAWMMSSDKLVRRTVTVRIQHYYIYFKFYNLARNYKGHF